MMGDAHGAVERWVPVGHCSGAVAGEDETGAARSLWSAHVLGVEVPWPGGYGPKPTEVGWNCCSGLGPTPYPNKFPNIQTIQTSTI
jgi:hypothetical protein